MTALNATRAIKWRLLYVIRFAFKLVGRGWNDFYAWMLDYQDRKLTLDQILARPRNPNKFKGLWDWSRGEDYLAFLKRHGLKPTDSFLDIGCGYGRVAIPVLRYQESGGAYYGTEISKRRIALAKQWMEREGLQEKFAEFILSKDNTLPFIEDNSIDKVWVLSVFNHMPDRELKTLLAAISRVLRPDGVLFAYYLVPESDADTSVKTFRRSDNEMISLLKDVGLAGELVDDWDESAGTALLSTSRMRVCRKISQEIPG